jgi:hypothetical protein
MAEIKPARIADHDLLKDGDTSYVEDLRFSTLTPEELVVEKKLRRRIDGRIMPLVILVYLMNCTARLRATPSRSLAVC